MRFTDLLTVSLLTPLAVTHGTVEGAPKVVGLSGHDIAALKSRNILAGRHARVAHKPHGSQLHARQGGQDGRCGPSYGCATCAEGYCCSAGGWCGQGNDYCQAPDSLFEYGPAADANVVPPGGSTRDTPRPKNGAVLYGGEGIYACTKPGEIAITYDDGPFSYTGKVLDLFKSYNFKATFFLTGNNLGKGRIDDTTQPWPALISRMAAEGHQIASHTWSHQDLSAITKEQRYEQMVKLEMAVTNIIGKFPTYMRPPYSSCSDASGCPQDMADLGYHVSYFDLDTDDYNNITPELQQNAKDRFSAAVNPSDPAKDEFLAIAHDIHYQTAYNLTGFMLDLMVKKGYKGVTMGECMGDPEANWYRTPSNRVTTTSSFKQPACASTSSASVSRTSSGVAATPTAVSPDSTCGAASGFTCIGFSAGECCSQYNFCGNTDAHCGTGCQPGFGKCGILSSLSSAAPSSSSGPSSSAAQSSSVAVSSPVATSSAVPTSPVAGASSTSRAQSNSQTPAASSSSPRVSSTLVPSTRVSSTRTSSTVLPSPTPSRTVSRDFTCGGKKGYTCRGFWAGECCNRMGFCGWTIFDCNFGCNPEFGKCS